MVHPQLLRQTWYRIAGKAVSVRLVGDELGRELPRALVHLCTEPPGAQPELLIEAWDEARTGIRNPLEPTGGDDEAPGIVSASAEGRYVLYRRAHTMFAFDRVNRELAGWVAAAGRLTQYERGRPWHSELLLWQRDLGLQPVHAGFIERAGQGILLGGPGGSGKSTTALVCMGHGWSYLADDHVAVERHAGGFVGHGLYASAHLEPDHLRRFEALAVGAIPGTLRREDKSLLLLHGLAGSRLRSEAPIRLLALPRVTGGHSTSFRRASRAEALLRVAPSSLVLLPYQGLGHQGMQALAELIEGVPSYWLELGRDFDQLPRAVHAMLEHALGG